MTPEVAARLLRDERRWLAGSRERLRAVRPRGRRARPAPAPAPTPTEETR
ncbi:hypothetical protein [Nocardioides sp. AX2bis]|nr:hypothetical protein [Nocardioides sp. AX2bis]VXB94633.1 hypothetical protein NOCARDAX2BIS_40020 [Nocardioides sp. AX2bis]